MENSTDHFQSIFNDNIRPILEATWSVIEPMKDDERQHINKIQAAVATKMGLEPKKTGMFVNYYLHQVEPFNLGYVIQGTNGGFVRGPRPVKNTPPAPKEEAVNEVVNKVINETIEPTTEETLAAPTETKETAEEKIAV